MSNPEINLIGTKRWYNDNIKLHRLDGPAVIWADSDREWYVNGQLHREDGPAREWSNGRRSYYINDQLLTEDEWIAHPLRIEYVIRENLKSILHD